MSINENQEFEAINRMSSERKAAAEAACHDTQSIYQDKRAKAKKKAAIHLGLILLAALAVIAGIAGLEVIGWINETFRVVLMCLAGAVAMFKAGFFYHEMQR